MMLNKGKALQVDDNAFEFKYLLNVHKDDLSLNAIETWITLKVNA